jgi:Tfp pilus assembly protein PilO
VTRAGARLGWRRLLRLPLAGVLALNLAVFAGFTLPRLLRDRRLTEHVQTLRTEAERARRNVAGLRERAATIDANTRDLARLYGELLPEARMAPAVLRDLDGATPAPGDRSWKREAVQGAPLVRFVVSLPVSGSYPQLVGFLETLERFPHFVTVDRVALRDGDRPGAGELDVVVAAYFRAEPGEVPRGR